MYIQNTKVGLKEVWFIQILHLISHVIKFID